MNADSFDFNGDPGTPNAAPSANDPIARLYDGSVISTGPIASDVGVGGDDKTTGAKLLIIGGVDDLEQLSRALGVKAFVPQTRTIRTPTINLFMLFY